MTQEEIEQELLVKVTKIQELLQQVQDVVDTSLDFAAEHKLKFDLSYDYGNYNETLNDAQWAMQKQFMSLVDSMGWSSSSMKC